MSALRWRCGHAEEARVCFRSLLRDAPPSPPVTPLGASALDGPPSGASAGAGSGAEKGFGLATLDINSGRFVVMELRGWETLLGELERLAPAELLIPDDWESNTPIERRRAVRRRAPWEFDQDSAFKSLTQQFGTKDLVGFGCNDLRLGLGAAGALLPAATKRRQRAASRRQRTALKISRWDNVTISKSITQWVQMGSITRIRRFLRGSIFSKLTITL